MFATIKSLIPEPRQPDQPRHYVGRHRVSETITARATVAVIPGPPAPEPAASAVPVVPAVPVVSATSVVSAAPAASPVEIPAAG
jgi:hypothetical protein